MSLPVFCGGSPGARFDGGASPARRQSAAGKRVEGRAAGGAACSSMPGGSFGCRFSGDPPGFPGGGDRGREKCIEWAEEVIVLRGKWLRLALCLAVPLGVGGLSALLTRGSMAAFAALQKPPLAPPGWLFPVVWSILFLLMGCASWRVLGSGGPEREIRRALGLYGVQLGFNFLWSILFFDLGWYLFAFLWLAALFCLILATARRFRRLSPPAGWLLLPYLLWVLFAGYLNLGIWYLN